MCKLRKKFKTYALCFTECVKITRKDKKRMNTLTMAKRKKEVTPNQKLAQAIQDHIGARPPYDFFHHSAEGVFLLCKI